MEANSVFFKLTQYKTDWIILLALTNSRILESEFSVKKALTKNSTI